MYPITASPGKRQAALRAPDRDPVDASRLDGKLRRVVAAAPGGLDSVVVVGGPQLVDDGAERGVPETDGGEQIVDAGLVLRLGEREHLFAIFESVGREDSAAAAPR